MSALRGRIRNAEITTHASGLDRRASNPKPNLDIPDRNCRINGTLLTLHDEPDRALGAGKAGIRRPRLADAGPGSGAKAAEREDPHAVAPPEAACPVDVQPESTKYAGHSKSCSKHPQGTSD